MEWVETTGKTVDEAKDLALDQLGVDEQDAEFDIVEEPRTGLFKRVRGEARVRARVKPRPPRPKPDRKGQRRAPRSAPADSSRETTTRRRAEGSRKASEGPAGPRTGRGSRKAAPASDSTSGSRPPAATTADTTGSEARERTSMDEIVTLERQAEIMEAFLVGLVDAFGADGEVHRVQVDDETVELDLVGEDLGLLIGPKGQTLQAVQDLARTVVQRREPGTHEGRVRVDISGYRQKRRLALERFVTKIAEEVARTGTVKALEPMGAADRKVAHDAVNSIAGVVTRSEGQEPRRWVVISPGDE